MNLKCDKWVSKRDNKRESGGQDKHGKLEIEKRTRPVLLERKWTRMEMDLWK